MISPGDTVEFKLVHSTKPAPERRLEWRKGVLIHPLVKGRSMAISFTDGSKHFMTSEVTDVCDAERSTFVKTENSTYQVRKL